MTETALPRRGATLRLLESRPAAIGLAVALAAIGLAPQFLSRTLPDIAFLLYAAGRVLDGARLYVDILEINPPLIVWLNMPVVAAARALGASEILAYRLAVVAVLAGSVAACRWILLRTNEGRAPARRRLLLLLLVFALFVIPRLDWGEREHLTLALTLPYVLLAVVRLERGAAGAASAVCIGLAAAVGIAIKPQFALLCLAREGLVMVRSRRWRPTTEGAVIVAAGMLYLAAVALVTPEYLGLVRELGGAYQRFLRNPVLVTALIGDGAAVSLAALVLAVGLWRRTASRDLALALVVATGAFYIVAVLQLKGWRYHFYPALAVSWVLAAILAVRLARPLKRWTERMFASVAGAGAATMAATMLLGCAMQAARPLDSRYDPDPSIGLLIPLVRRETAGRDLVVLSPNMASGFPLTTYAGARWPQRLPHLWPLVAAYDSAIEAPQPFRYRPAGEMTSLEKRVLATVAEDLAGVDAPIVLVLRTGPDEPRWGMRRLDLPAFLSRDERFARFFSAYAYAGDVGQYRLYRKGTPGHAAPGLRGPSQAGSDVPGDLVVEPPAIAVAFIILAALLYRRDLRQGESS